MRWYLTNHSYPELREVPAGWPLRRVWFLTIRSSLRDHRMLLFLATNTAVVGLGIAAIVSVGPAIFVNGRDIHPWRTPLHVVISLLTVGCFACSTLTWGGHIMRSHLRRVSGICRGACPECGYQLTAHLAGGGQSVQCPECGTVSDRAPFVEPYRLPW